MLRKILFCFLAILAAFKNKPLKVKIKPVPDGIKFGISLYFFNSILRFCGDIEFPGNFEFSGKLRKLAEKLINLSKATERAIILYGDGEKSEKKVKICRYSDLEKLIEEIREELPGFEQIQRF